MTDAWKQYEGQIVGGSFQLLQFLGSSRGSAVFLTERAGEQREKAAIKIVVADPRNADLQLSRWRLAAKLSHPNLLQLFDAGRCRFGDVEFLYVVTEFADEDLSQILPHRALTPDETRDMLCTVLEGLSYLHAKGFVNGRVKPSNIAAVDDRIKLSIDGLRRTGESGGGNYSASPYDAPEAATEKAAPESDVWSLGMTIVEVMTQQLPTWERMGQRDPQIREGMPAPLLDIARNCLRRDPPSRLTIQGIAARLQAATPVLAEPRKTSVPRVLDEPPPVRSQAASSKSRYAAAAIMIAVALALIFGVAKFYKHDSKAQADPGIATEPAPAPAPPKPAPVRQPEIVETKKPAVKPNEKKRVVAEAAPAPAPAPAPATPRAEIKEKPSGEIVPGEVLHQVVPDVPRQASNTISGMVKVNVRVAVDAAGNVTSTSLESPGPSKYFANLALKAAQGWTFSPSKSGGQSVPSSWLIRFEFSRAGAKALPQRSPAK